MKPSKITNLDDAAGIRVRHNPKLWISEGKSRFDLKWTNKELRWGQLLDRLQAFTRTQETQAEYFKMKKDAQDKIKDVGGFVGGTLTGGRRKAETVGKRYLLTFDLDFAPTDLVEQLQLEAPFAWAVYSTHKHTPENPRLRLIVPLARPVDPDEYEAVMRKQAEEIGLSYFDSTTFQPSRLMYWPSASRDAEEVFVYNDEEVLDPDEILARYPDWHDISSWPICPDEMRVNKKRAERQQDPLKKTGLVGTFCRTYTVPEAINAFLADIYTQVDENKTDRYTYTAGSTSGGLVVYDEGLFAYSHHGTDPAHGQDLNAFDLVRIHLFGAEDENTQDDVAPSKRPSYKAMSELVRKDPGCMATYDAERQAEAAEDFQQDTGTDPGEWQMRLHRTKSGEVQASLVNAVRILTNDPALQNIKKNDLSGFVEVTGAVPWRTERGVWTNADDAGLRIYIARLYNEFKKADLEDAVTQVSNERRFHPIKDYLKGLPDWDGVARAERLFVDYLGAEDCAYTREVAKRWLLAAVTRIFRPGCKFDYIPILSGPGGIGKSTIAAKLAGAWFSDNLTFEDMKDKSAAEKLRGFWILEIAELKGMRKTEIEAVKSFASRQEDIYRPAYARRIEVYKRAAVLIGTSNADEYLRDTTGNRRFWPIPCAGGSRLKAWDMTPEIVAQIWAEVMAWRELFGDEGLILPPSIEDEARRRQERALEIDEREGIVLDYIDRGVTDDWETKDLWERRDWIESGNKGDLDREEVTIIEIWAECLRMAPTSRSWADSEAIGRILKRNGWKESGRKRLKLYGLQRYFTREEDPENV